MWHIEIERSSSNLSERSGSFVGSPDGARSGSFVGSPDGARSGSFAAAAANGERSGSFMAS